MLKHIFTIIWNNRRQNFWLIGGLFIIASCLWFSIDHLYTVQLNKTKSLGFDWEHVYYLNVNSLTPESGNYTSESIHTKDLSHDMEILVDRLQRHPAVESACFTRMHMHYVWLNTKSSLKADTITQSTWVRMVNPDYFKVFRVKGAYGETPEELAGKGDKNKLIITQDLADIVYPGKIAAGKYVVLNDDSLMISAVCEKQKYNEYTKHQPATYQIIDYATYRKVENKYAGFIAFYIRVKPEADKADFLHTFTTEMREQLHVGNLYLADMLPMADLRQKHLKDSKNEDYTYFAVIQFFLLNVFLAVLGTFWFRTQQRKSELGLRIALGESKRGLLQLLLGEGILIISLAVLPALILTWNIGMMDLVQTNIFGFGWGRFLAGWLISYALLIIVVLIAVWFPARQVMKIQPAEALRDE